MLKNDLAVRAITALAGGVLLVLMLLALERAVVGPEPHWFRHLLAMDARGYLRDFGWPDVAGIAAVVFVAGTFKTRWDEAS